MKIKSFFAAILAVLVFSACNNEVMGSQFDTESLTDIDAESQEKGFLLLNLINSPATRTSVGDSETGQGSEDENTINSLTVAFATKSGEILILKKKVFRVTLLLIEKKLTSALPLWLIRGY